jgi:kynurenine formamidase
MRTTGIGDGETVARDSYPRQLGMKRGRHGLCAVLLITCLLPGVASSGGDGVEPWWPSSWGPDDQLGALNHHTSSNVLEAARLIRVGRVVDMAHTITQDIPTFHDYTMTLTGGPDMQPLGSNRAVYNGELIEGRITAVGTQFDSLGHVGRALGADGDAQSLRYYNGFRHSEIAGPRGFTKLGVERVPPIFTRGLMVDLAAYKGRNLAEGEEITIADLEGALAAQGMSKEDVQPGDAFFFHTGFGRLWDTEKHSKAYMLGTPGFTEAAAHWLADRGVIAVGGDQPALEPTRRTTTDRMAPTTEKVGPIHQIFLLERGVYVFENLRLETLAQEKRYRFAFAFGAIPFAGANASMARPFAIY